MKEKSVHQDQNICLLLNTFFLVYYIDYKLYEIRPNRKKTFNGIPIKENIDSVGP